MLLQELQEHSKERLVRQGTQTTPTLLIRDSIVRVENYGDFKGIQGLRDSITSVASDSFRLNHLGTPVPPGTVEVLELIRRFKQKRNIIPLKHLQKEIGRTKPHLTLSNILDAVRFLSNVGEVYFANYKNETLSSYVVLSHEWLISALSCLLRRDLDSEVETTQTYEAILA